MTTLAAGSRQQLQYVAEVTRGTTPASPAMKKLRFNSCSINTKQEAFESDEIRSDRLVSDLRLGMNKAEGDVVAELSVGTFDDMILAALGGAWTVPTTGSQTLAATAAAGGNQITRSTGDFTADGFLPGQIVSTAGFTGGNTKAAVRVKAVTALALTLYKASEDATYGLDLATDAAADSRTVALVGHQAVQGTTLTTFTIEQGLLDIGKYRLWRGCAMNGWMLDAKVKEIVKQTFTVLGIAGNASASASVAGSQVAAATNSPVDAYVGALFEGGTFNAVVTAASVKLENGFSLDGVVGSKYSPDVFSGRSKVTGTLSVFLPDLALHDKFIGETETSLYLTLQDPNGVDFFNVVVPRLKLTQADATPPKEGPVVMAFNFEGLADPVSGTALWVQRSN